MTSRFGISAALAIAIVAPFAGVGASHLVPDPAFPIFAAGQAPATNGEQPVGPAAARASAVMASARKALGGDKLIAVTTLVASGQTRQVQGDNLVPVEFEISCELPSRCVRRDEIPARENGPTTAGFNGEMLILTPPPAMPLPEPARQARLLATKQDFARLFLGLFASSFDAYPLTFAYVGQAEAPQGRADVVDAKGAGNFTVRLFVNADTHVPIMVSWQVAGRGTPPVENRLYYGDYKDTNGVQWPFRLRRAVGPNTVEETVFDRFRINTRIDAKVFGVR